MSALRELQIRFTAALFEDPDASGAAADIVANDVAPEIRLDIYRNNLREGFIKALAIGFPVIERLVGTDYFRRLAPEFQRAHPSRAGNLHLIGLPFPAYLRERFADTEYAYFADVAALEWAHEEAMLAANATPITADAFRDIDPARYEELRFELHPACALVKSQWPIVRIWRANQADAADNETIDLRDGGESVLVLRDAEYIEFHPLPPGDYAALEALAAGATLGAALEAAQAADATFDLGIALNRFLHLKILVGLSLPNPSTSRTRP